jgi:hypothetical protein
VYYRYLSGRREAEIRFTDWVRFQRIAEEGGIFMGLVVCKTCARAFISAQDEELCPECTARLNELYPVVRNFLRNHEEKLYTASEVSMILGIDLKDVEGLVALGLIDSRSQQRPFTYNDMQRSPGKKKNSVYHKKQS